MAGDESENFFFIHLISPDVQSLLLFRQKLDWYSQVSIGFPRKPAGFHIAAYIVYIAGV